MVIAETTSSSNVSAARPDITVVILSHNEEIHIARCIERAAPIAKRIVLIDSMSTDATVALARAAGAEVLQRPFTYHADQLRWGLEQIEIATEWVLRIDCDEYLESSLQAEIVERLSGLPANIAGVEFKLKVIFQGKWIRWGGSYRSMLVRLWKPAAGGVEDKMMDERICVRQGALTRFSRGDLVDESLRNIADWTNKHNGYSTKHMLQFIDAEFDLGLFEKSAAKLNAQGRKKRFLRENVYASAPLYLRAFLFFVFRYFILLGFLDGKRGFVWHTLQGFWHMLLIDVKIGEARRFIAAHGKSAFCEHVAERYGIAPRNRAALSG